jgi:hypothetical protein
VALLLILGLNTRGYFMIKKSTQRPIGHAQSVMHRKGLARMDTLPGNKVRVFQHLLALLDAEPWLLTGDERSLIGQVVLAQAQPPQHRALSDNLSQGSTYIDHTHNRATVYHYPELSPRHQVIAKLAAQVASNHTTGKPVETNYGLQSSLREEEVLEIVEIAALFHYTHRLNRTLGFVPTQPLVKQPSLHIVPDPLPYFYEGA